MATSKTFYVGSSNRRCPVAEISCSHPVSIESPRRVEVRIPMSEEKPDFHLTVAAKGHSPLKFCLKVNGTTPINDVDYLKAGESYKIDYDGRDERSRTEAPGLAVTADAGRRVDPSSVTGGRMVLKLEAEDDLFSKPVISFEEIQRDEWKRKTYRQLNCVDGPCIVTQGYDETDGPVTGRLTKKGTLRRNPTERVHVDWDGESVEIEMTFLFV